MIHLKKLNNTPQLILQACKSPLRLKEMQTLRSEEGEAISRTEGTTGQYWVRRGHPFWAQVFHQSSVTVLFLFSPSQPCQVPELTHSVTLLLIFQGCLNMTSQTLQSSKDLEALAVTKGICQWMFPRLRKNSLFNIGVSTWIFSKGCHLDSVFLPTLFQSAYCFHQCSVLYLPGGTAPPTACAGALFAHSGLRYHPRWYIQTGSPSAGRDVQGHLSSLQQHSLTPWKKNTRKKDWIANK